jgi:alcohol dehydrogenase YqhD (iron-dependent ADH family)
MEEMSLTREQEIEATMAIFGGSRMDAEALVAVQHGESAGSCVAVDEHGKEIPAAVAIREKKPAA